MKKQIVTIAANKEHYESLYQIKDKLEGKGLEVKLPPQLEDYTEEQVFSNGLKGIQDFLYRDQFRNIDASDILYVYNLDKNNEQGYIGANCFLQIGYAFINNKDIIFKQPLSMSSPYFNDIIRMVGAFKEIE